MVRFVNPAPISLAELHLNFQLYEKALRDLERLERTFEEIHKFRPRFPRGNWWATERLRLLTEVWLRLGQPEKALETAKVLEARNHPVAQGMFGMALIGLGRYSEAEKYFQRRLDSVKGTAWPQKEVDALLNLGKICQEQKRHREADSYLQRALELYRQMGNRRGELEVLLEIAQLAGRRNDLRSSDERSHQALVLANQFQDPQGIWSAQYRLARNALSRAQRREAIAHLEGAVEAVETVSGNIKVDLYKTGFLEDKIQVFDELIALLGPIDPAKAFYYAERRRARAFLESSQRAGLLTSSPPDDLRRRKETIEARLVGKQRALLEQFSMPAAKRNPGLIQSLQGDLKEIREEHTQLIKTIERETYTGAGAGPEVAPVTANQVQRDVLKPGQALLEYVVRDRETFLFLVTQRVCKFYRLPIARHDLAVQIEKLQLPFTQLREGRTDLLHLSYDVQLSHELYRVLFQPIESTVQADSKIIVVPDDVLNYLPFESLARSGGIGSAATGLPFAEYRDVDWLLKRFTFVYALSATSLRLRLGQPGSAPRQLLAFGNPAVRSTRQNDIERAVLRGSSGEAFPEFPPLPQAARESKRVGELMSGKLQAKIFLGEQATESEYMKEAPSADYVHFAVHSLINQEQPYYSALVLTPDRHSDGLLQTYEIVNTRLHSRLVTLSGCETALGKLRKGEGMLGLQRAFLQAGAESVVVSLWSVEDSTADFMEGFYRNIRNSQELPVALRNAKLQYLEGTLDVGTGQRVSLSHPFFWAPFVLTTTSLEH
jgi:CHAT domain-containing protein